MEQLIPVQSLTVSSLPIFQVPSYGIDSGVIPNTLPQGQYVIHGMQDGDTLYEIAQTYYGDANQWVSIFEADGTNFTDFEARRIPIGTPVYLPVPDGTPGNHGDGDSLAPINPRPFPQSPLTNDFLLVGKWQPYVIQDGDTLWTLALSYLSNPFRWQEIRKEDGTSFSAQEARGLRPGNTVYLPIDGNPFINTGKISLESKPGINPSFGIPDPGNANPLGDLFSIQTQIPVFESSSVFESTRFIWDTGVAMVTDDNLRVSIDFQTNPDSPLLLSVNDVFSDPFIKPLTEPSVFVPIIPDPSIGVVQPNKSLLSIPLNIKPAVGLGIPGFIYELELNASFQESGDILGQPATVSWEYTGIAQVVQIPRLERVPVISTVVETVVEQVKPIVEQVEQGFPGTIQPNNPGRPVLPLPVSPVTEENPISSPEPSNNPFGLPDFLANELEPNEVDKTAESLAIGLATGTVIGGYVGAFVGGGGGVVCAVVTAGACALAVPALSVGGAVLGAQIGGIAGFAVGGLIGLLR
ncbi:MAG: LysM peptidoglycan-binding domain-containing protein [Nodosilinea sp. WJT8-NPBG4]|jgi:hypothetical protein|nr:LysM peptidoglycan-binding domain-containing protein [Nodosilinea sp. WJT8-NPBG4]